MIVFDGQDALSAFRLERLNARIAARGSRARVVAARHVYFVDPMPGAQPDLAKLGAILRGTPADATASAASVRLAVPRLGTISPWASKATEILLGCGLPVHRVERGVEYVVAAVDDEAAVAAELHDPMTQTLLRVRSLALLEEHAEQQRIAMAGTRRRELRIAERW